MLSAAFLFQLPACAVTADVTDISNRAYAENVLREINGAKESVYMAMYSMYLQNDAANPVLNLVEALIKARSRGVYVRVYLDCYSPKGSKRVSDGNDRAFRMLQDAGIDAFFIRPDTKLHVKLLVIDDAVVIDGSTNWTQNALRENRESAQIIRSKEFAKVKLAQMEELEKLIAFREPLKKELRETVRIGKSFLEDARFGPAMVTNFDQRTFDFYLLLLEWFQKDRRVTRRIDYVYTAKQLGIKVETGSSDYRKQVRELARKLKAVYFLADYSVDSEGNLDITLLAVDTKQGIDLPLAYWEYGLNEGLSLKAKFMYLVSLYEQTLAKPKLWWSKSYPALQDKYHVFMSTLAIGMMELESQDLIEVRNSLVDVKDPQRYASRAPNQYRLKALISGQERAGLWLRLERELGRKAFTQAKAFAALIEEDHDIQAVKDLARIAKRFGADKTRSAVEAVAKMAKDNPYRSIACIVSMLEKGAGKEE